MKIATRLSSFRGEASVTTWAYRVAVNPLLTTRRRRAEDPSLTFAVFGRDLAKIQLLRLRFIASLAQRVTEVRLRQKLQRVPHVGFDEAVRDHRVEQLSADGNPAPLQNRGVELEIAEHALHGGPRLGQPAGVALRLRPDGAQSAIGRP